jgi:hypothetical protein
MHVLFTSLSTDFDDAKKVVGPHTSSALRDIAPCSYTNASSFLSFISSLEPESNERNISKTTWD